MKIIKLTDSNRNRIAENFERIARFIKQQSPKSASIGVGFNETVIIQEHEDTKERTALYFSPSYEDEANTQHDGGNGLNNISFAFPIVADFSILSALHKNPESGLQVCLHVYTRRQVRQSLHLKDDGQVLQDSIGD